MPRESGGEQLCFIQDIKRLVAGGCEPVVSPFSTVPPTRFVQKGLTEAACVVTN